MFAPRAFSAVARRAPLRAPAFAKRSFTQTVVRCEKKSKYEVEQAKLVSFDQVKGPEDLIPPGAQPGSIPTDLEQATGLERLELLGKMQGVDIFDLKPLDTSRLGTMKEPIMVKSAGEEQYIGCTGVPSDSHVVKWITISKDRPIDRCPECGNTLKMDYIGPEEDPHAHDHDHGHGHHAKWVEPKNMADYVKPEYWYK